MITSADTELLADALHEMRRFSKKQKLTPDDRFLLMLALNYSLFAKLYSIDCAITALARNVDGIRAAIDRYPSPK